jgi:hypothetical protein
MQIIDDQKRTNRIHIVSMADGTKPSEFDDTWVVEYDPHRRGRSQSGEELIAFLVVTKDPSKAKLYTAREVIDALTASNGTREDGEPSRPLRAFNVEIG